jgi:ubiquinol-cytochrome c reductase cytochrome c subunit
VSRLRALAYLVLFFAFLAPVGLILAWGGSGAGAAPRPRSVASSTEVQQGALLYQQSCVTCHGPDGAGTGQAPTILGLGPAVVDFELSTGRMPLTRLGAQQVRKPPAFTRPQIQAIIAYLGSLAPGGTPIPDVRPALGSLSEGQQPFMANCAACHGATGNGGSVGNAVAPNLHVATATQIGEAVRIGPGTMPVFSPATLTDRDLDSLVRYVLSLRRPQDRGGAGLGHAGPIIEGFVALLLGLGTIVVVTRFTGTRS